MSPVAGTTRYLCPLECGWHHDVPPPTVGRVVELGSTADLAGLPPGEAISAMATQAYLAEAEQVEEALLEHLATHTTEQFVRTIQGLRAEVARLRSEDSDEEPEGGGHDFQWGDDHVQRCTRCTLPHSRWSGGSCPGPDHPLKPGEYV